jgi:hypothetical protein
MDNKTKRNLKDMPQDELAELLAEKPKDELVMILTAATPDLVDASLERISWLALPFIPEDLGFEEKEIHDPERGTVRIYHKGDYACTRMGDGWNVTLNGAIMNFKITSKFHAFQLFKMLGMDLKGNESSVTGLDKKLIDIIDGV